MTAHARVAEKTLRPVVPSYPIEQRYRRRLRALIDEMAKSVLYWTRAAWRSSPPVLAQDETPAQTIQRAIRRFSRRWIRRFDDMAQRIADAFERETRQHATRTMQSIMREAGFTVKFVMTPAMRDVAEATIQANVALIRSIPQKYLTEVEGIVMRGVQRGGDLEQISKDLQKQYGVTRRRADLIARDQNRKATAAFAQARQLECGLTEAVWVHSHAGKTPRPTHVKAGREKVRFKIAEGWYDPDPRVRKRILPGELISCRCLAKPIVKGFS